MLGNYFVFQDMLDLMHLKKRSHRCIYLSEAFHGNTREVPRDYTVGSRDGNCMACATVYPQNTAISMRVSDSASMLTAKICFVKAVEKI